MHHPAGGALIKSFDSQTVAAKWLNVTRITVQKYMALVSCIMVCIISELSNTDGV